MDELVAKMADLMMPVANYMMAVDMFPVFFFAHFCIGNILVREDSKHLGSKFQQKHPFVSWLCTFITCLSGVFVANFLFGDPLLAILQENFLIGYLTVVWYLMNYSPFDLVYKVMIHPAVIIPLSIMQECLRLRFLYLGMETAAVTYPKAPLIILLGGIIKGNGYGFIKVVERLIRGHWNPKTNEFLELTYFAKSGAIASFLFLLHRFKFLIIQVELLYLFVLVAFITGRLIIMLGGVSDPLAVIEAPFCRMLFGNWIEESILTKETNKRSENDGTGKSSKLKNGTNKKTTDKKRD